MVVIALSAVGALLAAAFVRSAWTGTGRASRIVQFVYYRFASLENYQKSGERFASATSVWKSGGAPAFEPVIRRIAPSQVGWFSARFPTDKGTYHGYLDLYDALVAPYRDIPGVRLLEVGVKKGGSLVLWRELFGEDAWIYGIDVNPDVPMFTRDGRIKVLILDSTDAASVRRALLGLSFDVIIDDGLHFPDAQLRTFLGLAPHLKPTGVYVIEDVDTIDVKAYEAHGMEVRVFPDRSGEKLAVLYPPDSLAPRRLAGVAQLDAGGWPS